MTNQCNTNFAEFKINSANFSASYKNVNSLNYEGIASAKNKLEIEHHSFFGFANQ